MHSVFLYHAIKAGMDMGIVNAGQLVRSMTISIRSCARLCEDVILNRVLGTERLLEAAQALQGRWRQARRKPTSPGAMAR
jgi:5-methyltetrahydrofolate--homocysteine methyltransferase